MEIEYRHELHVAAAFDAARLRSLLMGAHSVVLVAHTNADGDAAGSVLGLAHALRRLSEATVVPMLPDGCPADVDWLPGADRVLDGHAQHEACLQAIAQSDLIVALDVNAFSRTGSLADALLGAKANKVLIDHHENPDTDHFDVVVSDPSISSTCELVHWTLRTLFGYEALDRDAATCLFTGLCTDTGTFAYSNMQPGVYLAAADLLAYGIDATAITRNIKNVFSPARLQFFGYAISQLLTVYAEPQVALMVISQRDMEQHGVESHELTGLINEVMRLRDVDCGILIREEASKVRLSLRSKTHYDVNRMAGELFGGGGHVHAAGATSPLGLEATVATVKQYLDL